MKKEKVRKSKVTLSIQKGLADKGKKVVQHPEQSLSGIVKEKILEKMELEKQKKKSVINSLMNLIPENEKRNDIVDWKKEIKEEISSKHG